MNHVATTKIRKVMTHNNFLSSLSELYEKLESRSMTFREIKAVYFSLNLDYIRFCEIRKSGNYYPSKTCDGRLKNCTDDSDYEEALGILRSRINEITNSLK